MSIPIQLNDVSFTTMTKAMEMSLERQKLIANNLANVNTPGYVRRDLDFQSQLARAISSGDTNAINAVRPEQIQDLEDAPRLDGNNVNVSRENNEMMQNGLYYNMLTKAFNTKLNILRTAMRS